jgi:hypothetical protein
MRFSKEVIIWLVRRAASCHEAKDHPNDGFD